MENRELIRKAMKNKEIMAFLEKESPDLIGQMAGVMLSNWLPDGPVRKILLFGLLITGIVLASIYHPAWILLSFYAITFSPRAIGQLARLAGRLVGNR